MTHEEKIRQRVATAKHLTKPGQNTKVCRDQNGKWLFEVYLPPGATIK